MNQNLDERILKIVDLARGGAGVAKEADGRVVFVPFTAPGDTVKVKILEAEKRYAQAELLEVIEPSPIRVQPRCPAFGRCGGCQWQHLPYDLQWKTKSGGVRHALARVQAQLPDPFEELPAEQIWNYRNRIQLRGFQRTMGFFAAKSHDTVELDHCDITRPEINAIWEQVREKGSKLPRPYKVELEVLGNGEVRQNWNQRHAAGGFRQVHDAQNEKLQSWISRWIPSGGRVLDLFGGAGNLSLPLASRMSEIDCVDLGAPAEAPPGTPENYRFHRAPVLAWLLKNSSTKADGSPLSVILDPPREGLGRDFLEIATALEKRGAVRLLLVGCDADSWARDLSRFLKRGWKFEAGAVLDLFPQTHHVESLALLVL